MQAPDSLINKYRNKTPGKYHKNPIYAAMIEKLDDIVVFNFPAGDTVATGVPNDVFPRFGGRGLGLLCFHDCSF